jgi:glycine betaine catabolism B
MIFELSDEFVNVANAKDIQPSQMKAVEVNGEKVCLANVEGKYYAIGNVCTHLGGPLAEGKLEGYEVQCPWHGSRFDIRTGIVAKPPAARSEPTYEIKLEDDNILVKNRAKSNQS